MQNVDHIVSPSIGQMLDRAMTHVEKGADIAIVGPSGSGISSVIDLLSKKLQAKNPYVACLDCRSPGSWQDKFRDLCEGVLEKRPNPSDSPVLLIDHINDLTPDQIIQLHSTVVNWKGKKHSALSPSTPDRHERPKIWWPSIPWFTNKLSRQRNQTVAAEDIQFKSLVWAGNIDCRSLEDSTGLRLSSELRYVLETPEYNADHLLALYSAIGARQDSQWGEAIQYTLLDWCGTDLALADSLGTQFYGNWSTRHLYDDAVEECICRWLKTDPLVEEYRQIFVSLSPPSKQLIQVLNSGGKIPSHSPHFTQEPSASIRHLFAAGVISPNLLPGYYQYRNLTMRFLALQSDDTVLPVAALQLLRKHSNGRIAAVLQDAEISLRMLALRCFKRMGYEAVQSKLQATRTDEQAIPPDLRVSLQEWAKTIGGPDQQKALGQHLKQYQDAFMASNNLWTRLRALYSKELEEVLKEEDPLPLDQAVAYMTFGELANLLVSISDIAFPRWSPKEAGKEAPAKRWPTYMALLRRLRNQSAHLRNVALQDTEDLLTAVREIRKDIETYA